jgi:hypothetical protein
MGEKVQYLRPRRQYSHCMGDCRHLLPVSSSDFVGVAIAIVVAIVIVVVAVVMVMLMILMSTHEHISQNLHTWKCQWESW